MPITSSSIEMDWSSPPSSRDEFEVAIFCALRREYDAVELLFDRFWDDTGLEYGRARGDVNMYTTGLIGKHNIVLVLLVDMGKGAAAAAASSLCTSYPGVRLALLVGICGGTPKNAEQDDILLGDVVISHRIVQYDFGGLLPDGVHIKATRDALKSDLYISEFVDRLKTGRSQQRLNEAMTRHLEKLWQKDSSRLYEHPGFANDILFEPTYRHKHRNREACKCRNCLVKSDPVCEDALQGSCKELQCDSKKSLVTRERLSRIKEAADAGRAGEAQLPVLHFGVIGGGDLVIKSGEDRDHIAKHVGAIAFEMESAGIFQRLPGVVIKAVCDYADSHKNKSWQDYAAATAASAMKALLEQYIPSDRPAATAPVNCESALY
jgi:nucleoside phosphorylase